MDNIIVKERTVSTFEVLSNQDISKFVKKVNFKNGSSLTYLPWASAWGIVKNNFPGANYKVYENDMGWDYFTDTRYCWVKVGVTIEGLEHIVKRPVMNQRNEAIPYSDVTATDVNKAHMRALCKACAMHGLGLSLWLGLEDMDWDKSERSVEKKTTAVKATSQTVMPPAPKQTAKAVQKAAEAPTPVTAVVETPKEAAPAAQPQKAEPATVEVKAEAAAPEAEEPKKLVCNKDGKLWYGSEVFEFKPKTALVLDSDPEKAKQQVSELGKQPLAVTDVKLKDYANQPIYKAFWDMIKKIDVQAMREIRRYLDLPLEKELPKDQLELPCWEKLPPEYQVTLTQFAQLATFELTNRKFHHPK